MATHARGSLSPVAADAVKPGFCVPTLPAGALVLTR